MSKRKQYSGKRAEKAPADRLTSSKPAVSSPPQRWKILIWGVGCAAVLGAGWVFFEINSTRNSRSASAVKVGDSGASANTSQWSKVAAEDLAAATNLANLASQRRGELQESAGFYRPVSTLTTPAKETTGLNATNISSDDLVAEYNNQANELRKKGRFREALELYRKALAINPEDEELHFSLAFVLAKTGVTNEATLHYNKALEIFPEYTEAHNNLGNLLLAQGKVEEAIGHFKTVVTIAPDNEKALNNLGIALNRQGKSQEAAAYLVKVLRINPDYLEARFNLAYTSMLLHDTNTAEIQFTEILKRTPDKVTAQILVGTVLAQSGELNRAESYFAEALQLNPDSIESRYNLALIWLQTGQKDLAITALKEILQIRSDFQPAVQMLRTIETGPAPKPGRPSTNSSPAQNLPAPATKVPSSAGNN